jgi:hypothetical protein
MLYQLSYQPLTLNFVSLIQKQALNNLWLWLNLGSWNHKNSSLTNSAMLPASFSLMFFIRSKQSTACFKASKPYFSSFIDLNIPSNKFELIPNHCVSTNAV